MVKALRAYQQEAVEAANIHLNSRGYAGTIIHLATGLGKTVIASEYIKQKVDLHRQRVWFIVNSRELVWQTGKAFTDQFPELRKSDWTVNGLPGMGIVMGSRNEANARVIIGTPQTLSGKDGPTERFYEVMKYGAPDLVIYDEAHYSVAKSFLGMHQAIREVNPGVKALGLTATPQREDGMALNMMFNTICYSRNIRWGIDNGYLCKIRPPLLIETNLELPGDASEDVEDRAAGIDVRNWSEILLETYVKHGESRKGVFFMPSIQHSEDFCKYLNENGIKAAHIDGYKTLSPEGVETSGNRGREEIFKRYESGDIQLLTNYNVLLVGWDSPPTSLIGWARPTTNNVLLTQGIGRGTRLYPGKEDLMVIDFALKEVSLCLSGTLLGYTWNEEEQKYEDEEEVQPLEEEFLEGIDLRDMRSKGSVIDGNGVVVRVGDLFKKMHNAWYYDDFTMSLSCSATDTLLIHLPDYTAASELQMRLRKGEEYLSDHPTDEHAQNLYNSLQTAYEMLSSYTAWHIHGGLDPIGSVKWEKPTTWVAAADSVELVFDYLAPIIADVEDPVLARKAKQWRKNPPTDSQVKLLKTFGTKDPDMPIDRGSASQMISHMLAWKKVRPVINNVLGECE